MNVSVRRPRYVSNVRGLGRELDKKLERIVARAARDGASFVRQTSEPSMQAYASDGDAEGGLVRAAVTTPRAEFWVTMFDKGTLGQREIPLRQPGRQESEWPVRRKRTRFTAHRSAQALSSGGLEPQYFFIRGKRVAENQLGRYLQNGL